MKKIKKKKLSSLVSKHNKKKKMKLLLTSSSYSVTSLFFKRKKKNISSSKKYYFLHSILLHRNNIKKLAVATVQKNLIKAHEIFHKNNTFLFIFSWENFNNQTWKVKKWITEVIVPLRNATSLPIISQTLIELCLDFNWIDIFNC